MPAETSEHEVAHGRVDHGLARLQLVLIVLGQAAKAPQPAEGAFHSPAVRLHLHAGGLGLLLGALDDLDPPAELLAQLLHQRAAVGGISPDEREARQWRAEQAQCVSHQAPAIAVLYVGGPDHDFEQEALGVDQEMPLAPAHLLVRVVAAWPPFCVVLTDWLSRIAALGVTSRPI